MSQTLKNMMDANTILFVKDDNRAYGFDRDYYEENNYLYQEQVKNPIAIYYKVNQNRNSWIDYQRAIELKSGSLQNRIDAAMLDINFKITDLRDIPETIYYDTTGHAFTISPFDGMYDSNFWLKRIPFKDFVDAAWCGNDNESLAITFNVADDIQQAIITLNSAFYPYEVVDHNHIIFRNIKSQLSRVRTMGSVREQYELKINVYAWERLNKKSMITPIGRINQWLVLPRMIEDSCFVLYNGAFYDYEVDPTNKHRIKLKEIDITALNNFHLDSVAIFEMESSVPNMRARRYITHGIGNRYKNSVDFILPIQDSMILYNGADSEYEIMSAFSIMYPPTFFSVMYVSTLNHITSINFMKGK